MATVHSLVCWGGRTGKTVTLTIASPCVVTRTNHGLRNGTGLVFSTTGALPTGITAGTTYYTRYVAANTFHLYDTEAHAKDTASTTGRINTSGTQSGTHTAKSRLMLDYFDQYPGRWGASGSERCYDGLASWNSARSAVANALDEEVCELGQSFDDYITGQINISMNVGSIRVESKIDGIRTEAYHNAQLTSGYCVYRINLANNVAIYCTSMRAVFDGFRIKIVGSGYSTSGLYLGSLGKAINIIAQGKNDKQGVGISPYGQFSEIINCLAIGGWANGFRASNYTLFTIANSISCGNAYGFFPSSETNITGFFYNNIFVGNSIANYYACTGLKDSQNNAGESGDTPYGINPITMSTADFLDYANNDFRPASALSPQVDAGIEYYGALNYDIADAERPNYNNGGSEAFDIGCYEFDHGYGDHPATATVTFSGVIANTEIRVYNASGTEIAGVENCSANQVLEWALTEDPVRVSLLSLPYKNQDFTFTAVAGAQSLPIRQLPDPNYRNP